MNKPASNTIAGADIFKAYASRASREAIRMAMRKDKDAPKPVASFPFGRGSMNFYDAAQVRAWIDKRWPIAPPKPAKVAAPAAPATPPACASGAELRYLVGMHEETQKVVEALLKGQQAMFKQLEGIATQVNRLVKELGVKEQP